MFNIIPSNRWITLVLAIGLLALLVYGAARRDPATIVIAIALLVFAAPVAALAIINWRQRRRGAQPDQPQE
jgi:hypothetical protein